jgi:hypothetical protein
MMPPMLSMTAPGLFVVHRRLLVIIIIIAGLSAYAFSGGGLAASAEGLGFVETLRVILWFFAPGLMALFGALLLSALAPPMLMERALLALGLVLAAMLTAFVNTGSVVVLLAHREIIAALITLTLLIVFVPVIGRRHLLLIVLAPFASFVIAGFAAAHALRVGAMPVEGAFSNQVAEGLVALFLFGLALSGQLVYQFSFYRWQGNSSPRSVARAVNAGLGSALLLVLVYSLQIIFTGGQENVPALSPIPLLAVVVMFFAAALLALFERDFGIGRVEHKRQRDAVKSWQRASARLTVPACSAGFLIAMIIGAIILFIVPPQKLLGLSVGPVSGSFLLLGIMASLILVFLSFRVVLLTVFVVMLSDVVASIFTAPDLSVMALTITRSLLIVLVAGAGFAWRQALGQRAHKRDQMARAVAGGLIPFVTCLAITIIAVVGFAFFGGLIGAGSLPMADMSALAWRLLMQGGIAVLLLPFAMTVLRQIRIL